MLENETQVRQILGTVNYCRMFKGAGYGDVTRTLTDLTRNPEPFRWNETHSQAVRHLKQQLIDYTIVQVPDTLKPFDLYTDASGYAISGVL